jgi:hypothetical protein
MSAANAMARRSAAFSHQLATICRLTSVRLNPRTMRDAASRMERLVYDAAIKAVNS